MIKLKYYFLGLLSVYIIKKIFDEYKIIFKSKQDYINIQIQKNNHLNVFESKFNLKYLHKYKLNENKNNIKIENLF